MSDAVADVLDKAAEVIETRGWAQGCLEAGDGSVCVVGAIRVAVTGDAHASGLPPIQQARTSLGHALGDEFNGGRSLPDWNDDPNRTAHQVIAALRNAAAAERAS